MWNSVSAFIRQQALLSAEGLHLVALSGGADSVALLLILLRLGYRVEAVHCNFHLRGEESDRDEDFVKELCEKKGVELHLIHFDTKEYASLHQVSIEMAARELRYRYFEQLRQDIGAETVCVAHHQDDAVETLLMNLMRGSGIHGMTGIRPRNGAVVRPLLCVSRQEIEAFLKVECQDFVTDSTNLSADVLRNKVRLQLLPMMEQLLPGSRANLERTSLYLAEAEKVYNAAMERTWPSEMPISSILSAPSSLCLLYEWLSPRGFNRTQVGQILSHLTAADGVESGRVFSSASHIFVIDRETCVVMPVTPAMKPMIIPECGIYRLDETRRFRFEISPLIDVSKSPEVATLDADAIAFPLTIREVQTGDRFQPYGMKGSKLVSDFLTDCKKNVLEKQRQLVVCDASGTILWLVGLRTAHPFRITDQTARVLRIEAI